MPLFGAHLSIAGGYYLACETAGRFACQTVQLFTKNNNQWAGKALGEEDIRLFKDALRTHNLAKPTAHDSYLINLASPDDVLRRRSIDAFTHEMERAEALGIDYLVMHPGTPTDGDETAGLNRIAAALTEILRRCRGYCVMPLLETTAGQGKSVGHRFEHLAHIRAAVSSPERIGVCLDTCHVFAAGYALAPKGSYLGTFQEFDDVIGLEHLMAFHLNDSKKPLGSRVDRHEHLGKGCLGLEPFRLLINDSRFQDHPMFLETPKEGEAGEEMDAVNLATLRELLGGKSAAPGRKSRAGKK
jgi:deoxyribonuclease-4